MLEKYSYPQSEEQLRKIRGILQNRQKIISNFSENQMKVAEIGINGVGKSKNDKVETIHGKNHSLSLPTSSALPMNKPQFCTIEVFWTEPNAAYRTRKYKAENTKELKMTILNLEFLLSISHSLT